ESIVTPHNYALARIDREGFPSASHVAFPVTNGNDRGLGIGIRVDAVFARPKNGECYVGSVDFEDLILREIAHTDRQCSFGQRDLHRAVIQVQKAEIVVSTQTQSGLTDV